MGNTLKYTFIGLVLLSLGACAKDSLPEIERPATSTDAITFDVITSVSADMSTRAEDSSSDLLEPLVLKSDEEDLSMYLHTYVADRNEADVTESVVTRAAEVNNISDFVSQNRADGFHIHAYDANSLDFIPQYAVAKPMTLDAEESVWNTKPRYYWPVDDRLLYFYAYAPMSAQSLLVGMATDNTEKSISFDYKAPTGTVENGYYNDAEIQPDIMFAISECRESTSVDGKVPVNFRHALSAIKFAVRDVVGGTIERITIKGVAGEAHCIYTKTSDPAIDEFVWSNYSGTNHSYTQTFNYKTTDKTTGDDILNASMPSKTFMLIPQDIPTDAEIEIVFTRDIDPKTFTLRGKIRDNNITKWEPGKEYIYTISTSSSNWTYHFKVYGSEQERNDDEPSSGKFFDSNAIILNQTVTTGGYYKVISYRERANNPRDKEPVAWRVTNISKGVIVEPDNFDYDVVKPDLEPDKWIPTKVLSGNGSISGELCNMVLYPQMSVTDYPGDTELQRRTPYGSADAPVDLSTIYGTLNTANCYVVNASGYFKFPLVYGNAIKNGATNSTCYTYTIPGTYYNQATYPSLTQFVDYKGNAITSPKINGAVDATLVWEDAYNLISEVKLNPTDGAYGTVSFKVNQDDLQQGNAVIAIRDANGLIIWSWHIWVTEHWSEEGSLKLVGDIAMPTYDSGYVANNQFYAAPRNLGWCDPKNVWYLKRVGDISFEQADSKNVAKLNIEQREAMIEYWIGNNTYYQFGRKDPIVGFMNTGSVVKYNFGPYPYQIDPQTKEIKDGIQRPYALFVGADAEVAYNDWLSTHYQNLWNNSTSIPTTTQTNPSGATIAYYYSGVKTVYDPCPAGYMVPPVGFFKKITNGRKKYSDTTLEFNGTAGKDERGTIIYKVNTTTTGVYLVLYGTGHRWYANSGGGVPAGGNFNPAIAYLWSNQINFTNADHTGYGLALGGGDNTSDFHFEGRRAMARPVRPIREL